MLVLTGIVATVFEPSLGTVFDWLLLVSILTGLDWLLAVNPRQLRFGRLPVRSVRAHETTRSTVVVEPASLPPASATRDEDATACASPVSLPPLPWRLRLSRLQIRDAWPPSAQPTAYDPAAAGQLPGRSRWWWRAASGSSRIHGFAARDRDEDGRWRLHTFLTPQRRGVIHADHLTVRSWGPLRLAARQMSLSTDTSLRCLPAFPSRNLLPRALTKLQFIEGSALANRRGQGTEFDSLREWVDGDDVRSIDWRASARTEDSIVVRTWRPERDRSIVIVMDTSRLSAVRVGQVSRLDAQMDAALLLAALCAKAGDSVSFIAADTITHANLVKPASSHVLQALSQSMTDLESALIEADWRRIASEITTYHRSTSLLVFLTAVEHASLCESLLPALLPLSDRSTVVLASVTDSVDRPEGGAKPYMSVDSVYREGAHCYVSQLRQRDVEAISSRGIHVVTGDPQQLPQALTDLYLELKANGRL